jgi:histone acetyltransferase (RNA polymerase elongator complex component)
MQPAKGWNCLREKTISPFEPGAHQPKPFVVPLFIPHAGCPHRCIFCDQTRTTGRSEAFATADQLHAAIAQFLSYRRDPFRPTEIAFFGGNFLGMAAERIHFLLELGAAYVSRGTARGLRFSTRPDTITTETLKLIAGFPVTTIELGVQSMNDQVLEISRRGHTALDTRRAMALLRPGPYRLGLQMMVGLPGDTLEQALTTAEAIAALAPDFVRIYPTLVLKDSPLARWHAQGRYLPMTLDETVDLVKSLLRLFLRKNIKVIRMGLQPTSDLNPDAGVVAGPFHPALGELVHSALWRDSLSRCLTVHPLSGQSIEIDVHPSNLSRIKGYRNDNFKWIGREFNPSRIVARTNPELPADRVLINGRICRLIP